MHIIDAHAHIMHRISALEELFAHEDSFGYSSCNILSIEPYSGGAQNAICIAAKLLRPNIYIFGSANHSSPDDFGLQAQSLAEIGFDGIKIIEGKPNCYKQCGSYPLNGSKFAPLYLAAQRLGLPILMHIADPPECWDIAAASQHAIENGWVYGSGYPSQEELFAQVDDLCTTYPDLKIIFAHFCFMSDDLPRADSFLAQHKNAHFDICPGTEMYVNFAKNPAAARGFFMKHQDRLIFGTDNRECESAEDVDIMRVINSMTHSFLTTQADYTAWDLHLKGINLPTDVLEKIYSGNFIRTTSAAPKPLNLKACESYLTHRLTNRALYNLSTDDISDITKVLALLKEA